MTTTVNEVGTKSKVWSQHKIGEFDFYLYSQPRMEKRQKRYGGSEYKNLIENLWIFQKYSHLGSLTITLKLIFGLVRLDI